MHPLESPSRILPEGRGPIKLQTHLTWATFQRRGASLHHPSPKPRAHPSVAPPPPRRSLSLCTGFSPGCRHSILQHLLSMPPPPSGIRPERACPHLCTPTAPPRPCPNAPAFLETPVTPPYSLTVPIQLGVLTRFLLISPLLPATSSPGLFRTLLKRSASPEVLTQHALGIHVRCWALSHPKTRRSPQPASAACGSRSPPYTSP